MMLNHEERGVIDDNVIRGALQEAADGTPGLDDKEPQEMEMTDATALALSYRNIARSENMECLEKLTELRLDNNAISTIENIGHLTNLTWLDLSFNNITVIEGLDSLVKLTDLSLFNNKITRLTGLESLSSLQILSVGNNQIPTVENLLHLRELKKLGVLNAEGNPCCNDPEYRMFALAHMQKLRYLDYCLVDPNDVVAAKEQFQDELEELKEAQQVKFAAEEHDRQHAEHMAKLAAMNLVQTETLFADMFDADTEAAKLQALPGFYVHKEDLRDRINSLTEDVRKNVEEHYEKLVEEEGRFRSALEAAQQAKQRVSTEETQAFARMSKRVYRDVNNGAHIHTLEKITEESTTLMDRLLTQEEELVEQCNALINEFESSFDAKREVISGAVTEYFRAVEACEETFFDSVTDLAMGLYERYNSDDADADEFDDDVVNLLIDRDTLNNAVNGSHDIHVGKILEAEDKIRATGIQQAKEKIDTVRQSEWDRNRSCVREIIGLRESIEKEVADVRAEVQQQEQDGWDDG